jgi:hypothetical protein
MKHLHTDDTQILGSTAQNLVARYLSPPPPVEKQSLKSCESKAFPCLGPFLTANIYIGQLFACMDFIVVVI